MAKISLHIALIQHNCTKSDTREILVKLEGKLPELYERALSTSYIAHVIGRCLVSGQLFLLHCFRI